METLYVPYFEYAEDILKYLRKHKSIPVYTKDGKKDGRDYIEYIFDRDTKTIEVKCPYYGEGITLIENGKLVAESWEIPDEVLITLEIAGKKLPLFDEWHKLNEERKKERLEKGKGYLVLLECLYPIPDQSSMQVVAFDEEDAMRIAAAESPAGCYPVKAGPIKFWGE